jgi:hypothetical protein
MIKLNDSQLVVLSKAMNNGDIVPAGNFNSRTIKFLIRKGFLDVKAGIKGRATDKDFAYDIGENGEIDNRRLFTTPLAHAFFEGEEEEVLTQPTAIVEKPVKAKKAKAPAPVVEEDEDFELADIEDLEVEDEEALPSSVVGESYKKAYAERKAQGGSGQGCADAIDRWMTSTFMSKFSGKRPCLDVVALLSFAESNGIETAKWMNCNNGMKRMLISKKVRTLIAKGTDIRHGKKIIFKGEREEKKAA